MTVGLAADRKLQGGPKQILNETWVRPSDWAALPAITPGTHRYHMLVAVWNSSLNYHRIDPLGTAYTVDWGDGSAPENFATGVGASHIYSWAGTPGAVTSLGYKTAVVQVYPQGAGVFTGFTGDVKHASAPSNYVSPLLDFECSAPGSTLPVLRDSASTQKNYMLQHFKTYSSHVTGSWSSAFYALLSLRLIEGLELSTPTSLASCFQGCSSLIHGPAMNTSSVSSFSSAFLNCSRMVDVPSYDYSAATAVTSMFSNCAVLRTVGSMNSGNCVDHSLLFSNCAALTTVPAIDTSKTTNLSYTFAGCKSLAVFPTLDTPLNLICSDTFYDCTSLVSAPAMDTSKVTTMPRMFSNCTSLTSVPVYDTSKVTTMNSMFSACKSLRTAPEMDTSKVTDMTSMFSNCGALQSIPTYDLTLCTVTTSMFNACSVIESITSLINTTSIVTATGMFTNCFALQVLSINLSGVTIIGAPFTGTTMLRSVTLTGLTRAVSVAGNLLQAADLDALYTSLGTAFGAQTVTVTSNPGIATDTPTIATGKGWTVTGS